MRIWISLFLFISIMILGCGVDHIPTPPPGGNPPKPFYFGADLSYVNQILDHGGVYKASGGAVTSPYQLFANGGIQIARFRLWHNPIWTKEIYDPDGPQLYNDLLDVEKAMKAAKDAGMELMLDFHYSDEWADPGKQKIPAAWKDVTNIVDLVDSVYRYTRNTMRYLRNKGLMPKYVQIGNEINCGMLYTDALVNFPNCEVCDNESWTNLGTVINAGIKGVRDVSEEAGVETEVILHIADPQHVTWWFDNIVSLGKVTDFDIIGFSYYPLWHTEVKLSQLAITVSGFRTKYAREVMILETAYPWTVSEADGYPNIFGTETPLTGFPFGRKGQLDLLVAMSQEMMYAGGLGLIYWEPAWITSNMQTMYGTGSAWENCALFDYNGEVANLAWFTDYPYE